MSRKAARFLTRLYPPAWRARYAAEFQTFLESRDVPLLEALNIALCALTERVQAGWRQALLLGALAVVFTFAGEVALYLGIAGHLPWEVWCLWAPIEAAAIIVIVPLIQSSLAELRPRLRPLWLIIPALLALYFALDLYLHQLRHSPAALACTAAAFFVQRRLPRALPNDNRGTASLAVSIVSISLGALGWGLIFGGYSGGLNWFLVLMPLSDVAEALQTARRKLSLP